MSSMCPGRQKVHRAALFRSIHPSYEITRDSSIFPAIGRVAPDTEEVQRDCDNQGGATGLPGTPGGAPAGTVAQARRISFARGERG